MEGAEDSGEVVEEEEDDDANLQGEEASGGRGLVQVQGREEVEEEEGAIHRDEDEGDVVLGGALRGDVRDHARVRMGQGEVVEVGRRSESVHVVSVVEEVGAFLEDRQPRDAWREGVEEGEEPVVAAAAVVEVVDVERNLVAFDCGETREEGDQEGDQEGGEVEEKRDAAVASLHPR